METEFNLEAAANELISNEASETEAAETVETEGQSLEGTQENSETTELSPEDILNQVGKEGQGEDFSPVLEKVNALNLVHNGLPIKIDSQEQLKEMLQKGFDYTKKTMAHSEEVRLKSEEFAQKEASFKQIEAQLAEKEAGFANLQRDEQIMMSIFEDMRQSDPELLAHFQSLYQRQMRNLEAQKPVIAKYENELSEIKKTISGLKEGKTKEELDSIKGSWEKGLNEVQLKTSASLEKLGVKVDWENVKKAWMADASNQMTVEQALYAQYGKDIVKANESQKKLLATKNKVQSSIINRSAAGKNQVAGSETVKFAPGDYENLLRQEVG